MPGGEPIQSDRGGEDGHDAYADRKRRRTGTDDIIPVFKKRIPDEAKD